MKKLAFILTFCITLNGFGQEINLSKHLKSNSIDVINRQITAYELDGVELDAKEGDGLAILDSIHFKKGTINLKIKGENAPGKSFVGLAFNVQNDSTYEAVYFRPFNFVAEDSFRKNHMVQYIAHPVYTWDKLRQERTDEFEGELKTPPSPDDWFFAKIELLNEKVRVYINEEKNPVFVVDRLAKPESGKIALWTGHESSGRFKELVIYN
ncbi:hypothetical protein [Marivirga sp.]|uniref:hypothetical protein n=1 Tax=Marivirga sp. TaxID=2018662 RepID=UPI002D7E209D|nr:hypothetical protein [Marivirga sp.]HET8859361.1 hypothetical protein [Marivirga sp.]